jgi:hypothetical protein
MTTKKPTKLKTTNLMTKEGEEEGGGGPLYLLLPL